MFKPYDKEITNSGSLWPNDGKIELNSVTMRYRETLEPSLKDVSIIIQPRMKVGIVGRTGAGKSSLLQALFRLCDLQEGFIKIDDVDITQVGLHALRSNIAFIPQSPFLMQGTIRENIDPFRETSDEEIEKVLKEVNLLDHIKKMKDGLETVVAESNNLFSVG